MLAGLILIILFVIVFLTLFITRNFGRNTAWQGPVKIIALIFMIFGFVILFYSGNVLESVWQKKNWPVSSGIIVKSEVVGQRAFHPEITYKFTVNKSVYRNTTDLKISGFGGRRSRRDTATRITEKYPVGQKVAVRYNPENPQDSYLRIGPFWTDYMKMMVGFLLSAMGLVVILGNIFQRYLKN